jgi:hypothetical protein
MKQCNADLHPAEHLVLLHVMPDQRPRRGHNEQDHIVKALHDASYAAHMPRGSMRLHSCTTQMTIIECLAEYCPCLERPKVERPAAVVIANTCNMSEPSTSGTNPVPPTPPTAQPSYFASRYASLKSNLKKYGRTGIAVYLGISTCVTAGAKLPIANHQVESTRVKRKLCTTGFYIAIEEHLDVTKFLGIKGRPVCLMRAVCIS